ncbi:MAG: phage virion morphogenesis protein [Desulfobacteraceae bacterium]|nr:phage virion morphogenesis protein [Desulfobacteraceae bacterium]
MVNLEVEIPGLTAELGKLDQFSDGLDDMAPFLKSSGMLLVASSQQNFVEGGRPDPWASLSDVTISLRREGKEYNDPQVMRDNDLLMGSIGTPSKDGVYRLMPDSIIVGTALKQAEPLHFGFVTGGFIKGKKVPARPIMVAQDEDKVRIYDMAVEFVDDRKKQAGL